MNREPHLSTILSRRMLRCVLPTVAAYWAIMIAIYVAVTSGLAIGGVLDMSMWYAIAGVPPRYWLLAIAAINAGNLRVYVAQGITRRQFAEATIAFHTAIAFLFALITTIGYGPEYLVYSSTDLLGGLSEPYPVLGLGGAAAALLKGFLVNLAHLVTGSLIGASFYRYGPGAGMVLIPVAVVPALGAEIVVNAHWFGAGINNVLHLPVPALPLGILFGCALLALGLAAAYRIVRTMPVRPCATR